ncbi:MAG: nitrilase-related carbon-nitrogen hydrolase [Thermodesulfobacteriota bacterium]
MKNIVKTAGIQMAPSLDRDETLKRVEGLVTLASENGAQIISLPELFSLPWFPYKIDDAAFSLAEGEDGPTVSFVRDISEKTGTAIIAPIFEKAGDDYFNTAFVVEKGKILGKYRKIHVPQIPLWEERSYFKAGDLGFPVFKTSFATIGALLCWDVFFPEAFRVLTLKGAEVVFAPTASAFLHSSAKWETAIQAASHANGIFVFRVNRTGKEEKQEFYGRSFCLGPDGEFVTKPAGAAEGVILADMDLNAINEVRNVWLFLKDRRPENYKEIIKAKK